MRRGIDKEAAMRYTKRLGRTMVNFWGLKGKLPGMTVKEEQKQGGIWA